MIQKVIPVFISYFNRLFEIINISDETFPDTKFYKKKIQRPSSSRQLDVISPIDGNNLSTVPMSSVTDLNEAVKHASLRLFRGVKYP